MHSFALMHNPWTNPKMDKECCLKDVYKQCALNNGSKIKLSNLTQHRFPPHTVPISLRPESSPWALGRRRVFVLTCEFHQPLASCVSPMACCMLPVSVRACVCEKGQVVVGWVLDSTGHDLEAHPDLKMQMFSVFLPLTGFTCVSFCY